MEGSENAEGVNVQTKAIRYDRHERAFTSRINNKLSQNRVGGEEKRREKLVEETKKCNIVAP